MGFIRRARRYWKLGNPFRKRIAYTGWQGHQNLGDEMMFQAHGMLFPVYKITSFERISPDKARLYRRITGRNAYDAGCVGGGTLIGRNPGFLEQARAMSRVCSIRFCIGTGVANPEFWGRRNYDNALSEWAELLKDFSFVGVRGPISASLLQREGLENVAIVGDSALVFARNRPRVRFQDNLLGLNIGASGGNVWGNEDDIIEKTTLLCRRLVAKGWKVLFLCVWPLDHQSAVKVAQLAGIRQPDIQLITDDVERACDLCESCTVFVGMKLHSVVTAVCSGVPSIMIEYRPKCRDFMASLDLEAYNVRSDSLDPDLLVGMVESLASQRERMRVDITERVFELRARLLDAAKGIAEIIREGRRTKA